MFEQYHRETRSILLLGLIVLPFIVLGLFYYHLQMKKKEKKLSQVPPIPKLAVEETILTSPMGKMGWHADDPNELARQVEGFLQKADVQPSNDIIALISPHAGYAYSGQTAAFGVKAAKAKYTRIIVIGPSHRVAMQDILNVSRETFYKTPLGETQIDTEFVEKLLKYPIFKEIPQVSAIEHSVWIQIPLLQYRFGDFKLVPIVAGQCSPKTIQEAASILKSLVDENTLVMASSDFTHYGPNYGYIPFDQNVPAELKKLDMGAYDYIAKIDSAGFEQYCDKTGATICGRIPIGILLSMLPASSKAELLKYTTSGEITGDYTNSVSYFSIAFHGSWKNLQEKSGGLSQEDRQKLLVIARKTIEYYLQKNSVPSAEQLGVTVTDAVKVQRAAFVTLKKNGGLRGCIGDVFPRQALYQSVIANAVNAAVNDYRFNPVTRNELSQIKIEISALTVPAPIDSYDKIRIGTDGVVLQKAGQSALFLPQVAPEQGWDIQTTLTQLSLKAGLPADAWKEGASFLTFQAEVFGEEK